MYSCNFYLVSDISFLDFITNACTVAAKAAGKDAADGAKAGAAMGAAAGGGHALLGAGRERRQARRAGRRQ